MSCKLMDPPSPSFQDLSHFQIVELKNIRALDRPVQLSYFQFVELKNTKLLVRPVQFYQTLICNCWDL